MGTADAMGRGGGRWIPASDRRLTASGRSPITRAAAAGARRRLTEALAKGDIRCPSATSPETVDEDAAGRWPPCRPTIQDYAADPADLHEQHPVIGDAHGARVHPADQRGTGTRTTWRRRRRLAPWRTPRHARGCRERPATANRPATGNGTLPSRSGDGSPAAGRRGNGTLPGGSGDGPPATERPRSGRDPGQDRVRCPRHQTPVVRVGWYWTSSQTGRCQRERSRQVPHAPTNTDQRGTTSTTTNYARHTLMETSKPATPPHIWHMTPQSLDQRGPPNTNHHTPTTPHADWHAPPQIRGPRPPPPPTASHADPPPPTAHAPPQIRGVRPPPPPTALHAGWRLWPQR